MTSVRAVSSIGLIALIALAVSACGSRRTALQPRRPDTTASVIDTVPSATLVAAGNIASCSNTNAELTAEIVDSLPGAAVVALGDNALPYGRLADYQGCYDRSWGRFRDRTYPVVGTHELDSSSTAQGFFDYFGTRAGTAGEGWYSFDLGTWHVIVLNTVNRKDIAWAPGSPQRLWLADDLRSHASAKCTMVVWHDPAYLSSNTPGFTERSNHLALWAQLYEAGVDVVLNGGEHDYERMAPLDAWSRIDSTSGIRQFNSGLGGEAAFAPTVISPFSQSIGTDFGVLKLTLKAGSYDWQFIPIAGRTFTDAGTGTCH